MRLELDDFSILQRAFSQEDDESTTEQDIEKYYQEKLLKMEQEYKTLIEQVSKDSYQKGFEEAKRKYEEILNEQQQKFQKELQQLQERQQQNLGEKLHQTVENITKEYQEFLEVLSQNFSSYVAALLEYLYIDKSNSSYVAQKIDELIEHFGSHPPVALELSPQLFEQLKDKIDLELKKNDKLEENDFIIVFQDFQIENATKEKLNALKDEIEQEITKTSAIPHKR